MGQPVSPQKKINKSDPIAIAVGLLEDQYSQQNIKKQQNSWTFMIQFQIISTDLGEKLKFSSPLNKVLFLLIYLVVLMNSDPLFN